MKLLDEMPKFAKCLKFLKLWYTVIWLEQVVSIVGGASSRDHLLSRLEAAPTVSF